MYLLPTQESVMETIGRLPEGPFTMLNLFRLREVADYSMYPELAPKTPVSCRELFYRYIVKMDQHLAKVGAKRVFLADGGSCLIGPPGERWDVVQIVLYPSRDAFIALGSSEELQAEVPHRTVMLEDSRVMPMWQRSLDVAAPDTSGAQC